MDLDLDLDLDLRISGDGRPSHERPGVETPRRMPALADSAVQDGWVVDRGRQSWSRRSVRPEPDEGDRAWQLRMSKASRFIAYMNTPLYRANLKNRSQTRGRTSRNSSKPFESLEGTTLYIRPYRNIPIA